MVEVFEKLANILTIIFGINRVIKNQLMQILNIFKLYI